MSACIRKISDNEFEIIGSVNFENGDTLYRDLLLSLEAQQKIEVNISQMNGGDSTGLALLVEWLSIVRQSKGSITFKYPSNHMLDMIKIYGLDSVLPLVN